MNTQNKKRGYILAGIVTASFSLMSMALGQTTESEEVYRVKPGDTLWQIAEEKLHSPWLWHELVAENTNLEAPYLIYPGDEIVISHQDGKQKIKINSDVSRISKQSVQAQFYDVQTGKLLPKKRSSKAVAPIPIIPLSKIKPFLHHSIVLNKKCDSASSFPTIKALKGEHLVVGEGDIAYAAPIDYPIGTILTVYRNGKELIHPHTHKYLGTEAQVMGEAEVIKISNNQVGTLKIINSYREMVVGDLLRSTTQQRIHPYFLPRKPKNKNLAQGEIIDVIDGVSQIGQYQIVTLTGGKDKFRQPGEVLAILHQEQDASLRLPKENAGQLLVFSVFDKVSYGLVVKATQPIYLLDSVASP